MLVKGAHMPLELCDDRVSFGGSAGSQGMEQWEPLKLKK